MKPIPWEVVEKKIMRDPKVRKYAVEIRPHYDLLRQILRARLARKMSQKQLAKKIGTKQSAISRLESGNGNPSINFLKKVARALDTHITITL